MINRADHDQKNYVTPEDFYNVVTRRSYVWSLIINIINTVIHFIF